MSKVSQLPELLAPTGDEDIPVVIGGVAKRTKLSRLVDAVIGAGAATAARDKAMQWADNPEDIAVELGKYSGRHWAAKALAQFQASVGQVALAAAQVGLATVQAGSAIAQTALGLGYKNDAASSAAASLGSANSALTAARASGNVLPYRTKAEANTALAGLTNLQVVEVSVDESLGNRRIRYRKESGAYVFLLDLSGTRKLYLGQGGNDANDGRTHATRKATIGGLLALALTGATVPDEINIRRGFESFALTDTPSFAGAFPNATIRAYGDGRKPVISARQIITGTWIRPDAALYPNTWKITVPFAAAVGNASSSIWQPAIWLELTKGRLERQGLTRYFSGTDIAANLAWIEAHRADSVAAGGRNAAGSIALGAMTCHMTGSTNPNPQAIGTGSASYDFYIALADGSNPNTLVAGGARITTVDQRLICYLGNGQTVEDIVFACSGSKDHIDSTFSTSPDTVSKPCLVNRCELIECAIHGGVFGAQYLDTRIWAAYHGGSSSGYGMHGFRATSTEGRSTGYFHKGCKVGGFGIGCGDHGAGNWTDGSEVTNDYADIEDCTFTDCGTVFLSGSTPHGFRARRCNATGAATIMNTSANFELDRGTYILSDSVVSTSGVWDIFGDAVIGTHRNVTIIGGVARVINQASGGAPTNAHTLRFINSGVYLRDGFAFASAATSKVRLDLDATSYFFCGNLVETLSGVATAAGAVLDCTGSRTTVDRLITLFGATVNPDTLTGFVQQTINRTLAASTGDGDPGVDLGWVPIIATNTYVSYSSTTGNPGDGTLNLVSNQNSRPGTIGRLFRVLAAGDVTAVVTGSIAANADGKTGVLTVTALTSGAIQSGLALRGGAITRVIVTGQLTGTAGGIGTYAVQTAQTIASTTITQAKYAYFRTNSYSGNNINVTPVLGTTTSVASFGFYYDVAGLNWRFFDALTAPAIDPNGVSIRLATADVGKVVVGDYVRVAVKGKTYPARKIASVSGNVITFATADAVLWRKQNGTGTFQFKPIDGTGSGFEQPATVMFGFPMIISAPLSAPSVGTLSVTKVGGGTETFTTINGLSAIWPSVNGTTTILHGATSVNIPASTLVPYVQGYSLPMQVDPDGGVVDTAFTLAPGDTLSFTAVVDLSEHRVAGNLAADPLTSGQLLWANDSIYARRGLVKHHLKMAA